MLNERGYVFVLELDGCKCPSALNCDSRMKIRERI
jgi:hypothetical protein